MNDVTELIPTRQSLLSRIKDRGDQEGWQVFFDTYWKLIYNAAVKAGLSDTEAQDVVQETVICVLKSMPGFRYNPVNGSFKSWLLRLTSWRIADQLRNRQEHIEHPRRGPQTATTRTATVERVADPVGSRLESIWDHEWEINLVEAAVERVKRKVDAKQYQVFDLYVVKKWPVGKVARTLRVNRGAVYLAKHRIGGLIKKEVAYLRTKPL